MTSVKFGFGRKEPVQQQQHQQQQLREEEEELRPPADDEEQVTISQNHFLMQILQKATPFLNSFPRL